MKKKSVKAKGASAAAADQDVVVLLTTLVQKLASFEAKIDTVLSRLPSQPYTAPRQQPPAAPPPEQRRESRPMYKAVCADCSRECEVPFRPSGDRPVYCKACFAQRKSNGTFRPHGGSAPKTAALVMSPAEEKKAAAPAKPAKKKKPAAKKGRKSRK